MVGWTDRQMHGYMGTSVRPATGTDGRVDIWIKQWMDRGRDGQLMTGKLGSYMDIRTDGQIDISK